MEDIKKAYDHYDTSQFTKHKELKNQQRSMVIIYHVFLVPAEMCRISFFSFFFGRDFPCLFVFPLHVQYLTVV